MTATLALSVQGPVCPSGLRHGDRRVNAVHSESKCREGAAWGQCGHGGLAPGNPGTSVGQAARGSFGQRGQKTTPPSQRLEPGAASRLSWKSCWGHRVMGQTGMLGMGGPRLRDSGGERHGAEAWLSPVSWLCSPEGWSLAPGSGGTPVLCTQTHVTACWPGTGLGLRLGPGPSASLAVPCSLVAFLPCQPLVFGAMVHRDEAFETILSQYIKITSAAASGGDS